MKNLRNKLRTNRQRILYMLTLISVLAGVAFATFTPWLASRASAAGTPNNVNMIKKGVYQGPDLSGRLPFEGCTATFSAVTKDPTLLNNIFYSPITDLTKYKSSADLKKGVGQFLETKVGQFDLNKQNQLDMVWNLISNVGGSQIVIAKMEHGDPGAGTINGTFGQASGICGDFTFVRLSATEWRANQAGLSDDTGNSIDLFMRWTMSGGQSGANRSGTLEYYDLSNPNADNFRSGSGPDQPGPYKGTYIIKGDPDVGGGDPGGGTIDLGNLAADWVDAAHIRVTGGARKDEIYQKFSWDAATVNGAEEYSLYFLTTATGDRTNMTWSTGNGCDNPVAQVSGSTGAPSAPCANHNGGSGNCVPFISVHQNINLNHNNGNSGPVNVGQFNSRVSGLGGADAIFYDYNPNCTYLGRSGASKLGNQNSSRVWFYYSTANDQLATVFSSGAGNEAPFIGRPAYVKFGTNTYQGGESGCNGQVELQQLTNNQSPEALRAAPWTLTDGKCATLTTYGVAQVLAIGGTAGEAGFNNTTGTIGAGLTTPDTEPPKIGCDFFTLNPLNWIVCPFIKAATSLVGELDDQINSLLTIDTKAIFDDGTPTGKAYHQSWAVFRTFALALIAIASLVMVVAQAAGLEFLDAYTIKKILPRLIIAAIGIALSWDLMNLACQVSNDLGAGIRTIIYTPFGSLTGPLTQLDNSTKFSLILLGTGGILAFGWVALLSLVVTALLACLIGFGLLVFRRVLITFLVLFAPLAIACSIMPNTQKVFKLWRESFFGALAVYVIIMAFIAVGRVFSVTALSNNADQAVSQIIAILAYFAPYFLIPAAFRLAGGFVATVGGIVNDRSRGAFDRLKNFRSNQLKKNMSEMAAGNRLQDKGIGKVFNRTTRGINAVGKSIGANGLRRGLTRSSLSEANDQIVRQQEENFKKSQNFQLIAEDDDAMRAGTQHSRAAAIQHLMSRGRSRAEANRAADAWGNATGNRWGGGYSLAAAKAMADTGTAFANWTDANGTHTALEDATQVIARAAQGRGSTIASAAGYINAISAGKGRQDLHPSFGVMNALANLEAGNAVDADTLANNNLTANGGARNYQVAAMKAWDGADPVSIVRQRAAGFQKSMDSLSAGYTQAVQDGDFQAARQYEARLQEVKSSLSYGAKENAVYFDEVVRQLNDEGGAPVVRNTADASAPGGQRLVYNMVNGQRATAPTVVADATVPAGQRREEYTQDPGARHILAQTPVLAEAPAGSPVPAVRATNRQIVADPTAPGGQYERVSVTGGRTIVPDPTVPAGQRVIVREVSQADLAQSEVRRPYDVNNPNAPS